MAPNLKKQSRAYQRLILVGGDILVLLSFVWIGRTSHALSITNLSDTLLTALPFVLGWFGVMTWLGLYSAAVAEQWRRLVPRLLLGWLIAGPLSLVLRALFLGRPIPGGIVPTFAIVAMVYIGFVALIWRLSYIWWMQRRRTNVESLEL